MNFKQSKYAQDTRPDAQKHYKVIDQVFPEINWTEREFPVEYHTAIPYLGITFFHKPAVTVSQFMLERLSAYYHVPIVPAADTFFTYHTITLPGDCRFYFWFENEVS